MLEVWRQIDLLKELNKAPQPTLRHVVTDDRVITEDHVCGPMRVHPPPAERQRRIHLPPVGHVLRKADGGRSERVRHGGPGVSPYAGGGAKPRVQQQLQIFNGRLRPRDPQGRAEGVDDVGRIRLVESTQSR